MDMTVKQLLEQTTALRVKIEQSNPSSARLPILIKDEQRLKVMLNA